MRLVVDLISIAVLVVSVAWFINAPGYDSVIGFLAGLAGLLSRFFPTSEGPRALRAGRQIEAGDRLAGEWLDAMQKQDLRSLGRMAGTPFYSGDLKPTVFTSRKQIRDHYGVPRSKGSKAPPPTFTFLFRSNTVRQWKAEGSLTGTEPVFGHIRVEEDDIVAFTRLGLTRFRDVMPEILKAPISLATLVRIGRDGPKVHAYWSP